MQRPVTALILWGMAVASSVPAPVLAEDIYKPSNWSALASDRRPERVGDAVTIIVSEYQQASNTVRRGSKKNSNISGSVFAGSSLNERAGATLGGGYDGEGTSGRTDKIVAQLSATVDAVLPNGDLHVSGWQRLNINNEVTNIRVSGRVRPEDVLSGNTIASSRLADAVIEYNGKGFASNSAKPGIVTRIFRLFGLL